LNQFTHIETAESPKYRRYHSYIDACNPIVSIYRPGYITVEKAVEAEFLELVDELAKRR
jgi:hypothetical protein